jgi:hypothetical protein
VIVVVPSATLVTSPSDEPMVATDVLLLLHVPPVIASVNATTELIQTDLDPAIVVGIALTVTAVYVLHPVPNV